MNRRCFMAACAGATAVSLFPSVGWAEIPGPELPLLDKDGQPLKAASLEVGETYAFHYPYVSSPCLLMNLGEAAEPREVGGITWPGGTGAARSIVAYLAICPHGQTHPMPEYTMVVYKPESQEVVCCSHGSRFSALGGQLVSGPSPLPLATVRLKWDKTTDGLTTQGLLGPTTLKEFFAAFERPFKKTYPDGADQVVSALRVRKLAEFSELIIGC